MLFLSGLRGVYISPGRDQLPSGVRGLLLGGGDDIDPVHYIQGDTVHGDYDPDRDALEMALAHKALEQEVPILGICRGAQLLNIVLGGNLHPDIRALRSRTSNRRILIPLKLIKLDKDSMLYQFFGDSPVKVNSLHHQAIKETSDHVKVVAHDLDGFVQAIEHQQRDFVIGVQWHPEYLPYVGHQRKLFKAFSQAIYRSEKELQTTND